MNPIDKELGPNYSFTSEQIDGRNDSIYKGKNYYYAGAYDQGFKFGRLEIKIVQDAIDTLNYHWHEAQKFENHSLCARVRQLREKKVEELNKLKKGSDL
jgi:hypothetical protein